MSRQQDTVIRCISKNALLKSLLQTLHATGFLTSWLCPCVQGRGWDEGGVIVGPEYPTPLADPFRPLASVPAIATNSAPSVTAADANPDLQLSVAMPRSVSPGESVSVTLEVVSLKSKAGGSPVEFTLDPIPASVLASGEQ